MTFETVLVLEEDDIRCTSEDGGTVLIGEVRPDDNATTALTVTLVSYDETRKHEQIHRIFGKRVRVTVEVLDSYKEPQGMI